MKDAPIHVSEWVLIGAGALFLISAIFLASGSGYSVWFAAKLLYALGVGLFLFNT
jgi:hypothetical protein